MKKTILNIAAIAVIATTSFIACDKKASTDANSTADSLVQDSATLGEKIDNIADSATAEIKETAKDAGQDIKDAAKDTKEGVKDAAHEVKETAKDAAKDVKSGTEKAVQDVKDAVK